jgi:hypothetical protein
MAEGNAFWSQNYRVFDQINIPIAQSTGWWGTNPVDCYGRKDL